MDKKQLENIKNLAAQRAAMAYGRTLEEELDRAGISDPLVLIEALDRTHHIHDAVMFLGKARPMLLRSAWVFDSRDEVIRAALSRGKTEGEG
jgi:hypothetical protein